MNSIQLTDLQLIHAFHAGDVNALQELINRYKDKLFTSILFLVRDKYLAEDMFQDTFVRIIDTIRTHKYNEEGKFLPWAIRIAHNLCVDHFRKVKRTPTIVDSDNRDVFEWIQGAEENAEQRMIRHQNYDSMLYMLDLLPAEQREVIILRHFADRSFKEIAELTNCSINTALGRMRYGLMNLRKMTAESVC